MELSIKDVTNLLSGTLIMGDPKAVATRAVCDSREAKPGDLFFAIVGERVDGHDYAAAAFRQGAVAAVVTRLDWMSKFPTSPAVIKVQNVGDSLKALGRYLRRQFKGPVIGVTGSNGKTTTKEMIRSILELTGDGLATRGNYNSQIGMPMVLSDLQKNHRWMVLEMGASEPGHISELAEIAQPSIGVLTSVGTAHLATFGTLEKIVESKWELMEALPADGCAIVPWGLPLLDRHVRSFKNRLVFFGEDPACPIRATKIEMGEKIRFMMHIGSQSAQVQLPIAGRFNVKNALAAAAVGWVQEIPMETIVQGLSHFKPPKMRMEYLHHPSGALILNDSYNANPASMLESVRSFVETFPHKKKYLVVGSMLELGPESPKYHFHVGAELGRFDIEKTFMVGTETQEIQNGAISSGKPKDKFIRVDDFSVLINRLRDALNSETVIFFKASRGVGLERAIELLLKEK